VDLTGGPTGLDLPVAAILVERGAGELVLEPDEALQVVTGDHAADVVPDLSLRRVRARPVGLGLVAIAVEDARDVACAPWVAVVAPGAAEI